MSLLLYKYECGTMFNCPVDNKVQRGIFKIPYLTVKM